MVKIPDAPVGPTVALPGSGSGVLQKPSDFADPNAGKELIPKELVAALKEDEERKQTLEVLDQHNAFADRERAMLESVRKREGKDALGNPDGSGGIYGEAKEWYDKEAQATLDAMGTDRQKLLMSRMIGANRDKGLDGVALYQAHQQKIYQEQVGLGVVDTAKNNVGKIWGDVGGIQAEASRAFGAIDAAFPGQDNTIRKNKAQQDIYGHAVQLALAYGDKDNYAYARELLFGSKGPDGQQTSDGFRALLSPEMQAHAVTTLRVQEKNTRDMNAYFEVLRDAGNNPAKAAALVNDEAYVNGKGWDGATFQHVRASVQNQAHYVQAQQDRAKNLANESASKQLFGAYMQNGGALPADWLQEFARKNPGAAHMAVPFLNNAQKAQAEGQSDAAEFALFQASLSGDLSGKGYQMLAQYGPALSPARRDHWFKMVTDGVDMKPAHEAFKQSAAVAGLIFNPTANTDTKRDENAEYVRTLRAYEDEVRQNPRLSQADMQKIADKYTGQNVLTKKKGWFGISVNSEGTFGEVVSRGETPLFRFDSDAQKPTAKQMRSLGMVSDTTTIKGYYQNLGPQGVIIRQGAIETMNALNVKRAAQGMPTFSVNAKNIREVEADALAMYGPAELYKKGQAAWIKAQE